jgi:hypothetical protein
MSDLSRLETWWTVTCGRELMTEVGPFATYEEAKEFIDARCLRQGCIHEYKARLVSSEEITPEEHEKRKRETGAHYLTYPAEF